jgi:predicted O-methyltransferase YrrM
MRRTGSSIYAAAVIVAAVAAAGFLIGGGDLAGYALLSASMCCAMALLWKRTARAQEAQSAAAERTAEGIAKLSRKIARLGEAQEKGHRALVAHLDRIDGNMASLGARVAALPEAIEVGDLAVREQLVALHDDVRQIAPKTRRIVREWSRMVYAEVEDLTALYRDIGPDRALPPLHGWAAGPDLARYLYQQVVEHRRTRVLECGSGSTTVVLAYAMRSLGEGHVNALEHDPRFAAATRRMLKERGLEDWATVIDAPLTTVRLTDAEWRWYDPAALPAEPIDLLLVDGPPGTTGPQARYPALPVLTDRLSESALVVLDDTRRADEHLIGERWLEEYEGWALHSLAHDHGTLVLSREAKPAD